MMASYSLYRASGLPLLGDLPEHWIVRPLSGAFEFVGSGTTPNTDTPAFYDNGDIPWVNTGDFNDGDLYDCEKRVTAEALVRHSALKVYPVNSVVIAMYGATIGKVALLKFPATVNQACCAFGGRSEIEPRFLFYTLMALRAHIISLAYGGGQPNISQQALRSLRVPQPPFVEQTAIVAFLDRETAKIDALVAEQRRLIELLKEKRQAVISHAVTNGLNPNVPMKDTGVEWLCEVPEHWEVERLKHVVPEITVGIVVEPSKYYCESGVPALRSLNVRPGRIHQENLVFISEEANELLAKSRLRAGDLVVVRTGQPGTTAVVPSELNGSNCVDLIVIRKPISGSEHFLCWYLSSEAAVQQFAEGSGGAIQQHFNVTTASNLIVIQPPADEQYTIAAFLKRETQQIDELVAHSEKAVELLQERRAALISAAVTGKIDVRGLVEADAPAPEMVAA
jgi:type I restriction enzyme, S subunit